MSNGKDQKQVKVKWGSVGNIEYKYVNNLAVTHAGEKEFHLTFGHLIPPNLFPLSVEEIPDIVEIKPVAGIVITMETMESFVKVLQDNYKKLADKKDVAK